MLAALNLAYQLAERGAAPPPAAPAAVSPPQDTAAAIDVDGLLQRVEAALADDPRLL